MRVDVFVWPAGTGIFVVHLAGTCMNSHRRHGTYRTVVTGSSYRYDVVGIPRSRNVLHVVFFR